MLTNLPGEAAQTLPFITSGVCHRCQETALLNAFGLCPECDRTVDRSMKPSIKSPLNWM